MSLDLYLYEKKYIICECGKKYEINKEEVYCGNITHNLNKMAMEAGIYYYLWRPYDINVKTAYQLIEPLSKTIGIITYNKNHFIKFNPSNGWGSYDCFLDFLKELLKNCIKYPTSEIYVYK